MSNLSNYGNIFLNFYAFVVISKKKWVDFVHIWYSNQVPCVADICKIVFGSMPNLSNYCNIFLKFDAFVAISQKIMD